MDLKSTPHQRWNALSGEWVLVSPHRLERPWQGQQEALPPDRLPQNDPKCYLCPGNERAGGERNPDYRATFCFTNDFPALLEEGEEEESGERGFFRAAAAQGVCRVVCYSPRHDLTLSRLSTDAIRTVVDTWVREHNELAARPFVRYVQIFENKGTLMGCSNPHPHGQIWATSFVPDAPAREDDRQRAYLARCGRRLLVDYLRRELDAGERIVCENETWVALVPWWAKWPFETMVLPRRAIETIAALDDPERDGLADILKRLTTRYDRLFGVPFPYTMGFHQAPTDNDEHPWWQLHAHFYPPLLRSATVQKFMVGFEMLGTPQRDLTPEVAAARLRALSDEPLEEATPPAGTAR